MIQAKIESGLEGASEEAVVQLVRCGDPSGLQELMRRYTMVIQRTAYSILRNAEDAEDATQEAFLRAYTKIGTFEGASTFRTWMTRIVINVCLMRLRQRKTRAASSLDELTDGDDSKFLPLRDTAPNPEEICSTSEMQQRLREAIGRLPVKLREITEQQIYANATVQEMAKQRGLSLAAAKSRLCRARRMLEQSMLLHATMETRGRSGIETMG